MKWKASRVGGYSPEPLVRAVLIVLGALVLLGQLAMASRQRAEPLFKQGVTYQKQTVRTARGSSPSRRSDEVLLEAIIQVESGGNPRKVGRAGERGLMQIKKDTWREVTTRLYGTPIPFDRAFEPELNRIVGRAYLAELRLFLRRHRARWGADERSLLLACYNTGPTRVRESSFHPAGWPAFTRDYVQRVIALHEHYLAKGRPAPRTLLAHLSGARPSRS